ncbi:MAG: Lrp/AsnC family transcriptional regulator [Pseudomonadota bacterium]
MDDLDTFDRRILALLQVNSRRTGEELSTEIGLSPAACLRRLQRLRKIGAIEREIAVISPKFDPQMTRVLVLVTLKRESPKQLDEVRHKLQRLEEVERIFHVTGEADLALIVKCASMEDYAMFTETHLYEAPFKGFESLVVLREDAKLLPDEADQ